MRRVVLEFVREPVAGRVKQRLAATEGPAEALRIYRALAEDVHAVLLAAQAEGVADLAQCVDAGDDGGPPARAVAAWLPHARHRWAQGPGDLGARLERCFARAFAGGAPAAAAVGTDVVGLNVAGLRTALDALGTADVAMAATPDGGYALLALRRPAPALFRDIPWSTPQVAAITRARARAAGLALVDLPPLADVDVAADLAGVFPLVSILVPVLDEMPRLAERLGALADQAGAAGPDVEVVVVDGGSRDGSPERARALGLNVIDSPRGRGMQLANGARAARGRWLWTVHADARPAPGTLARVLEFARRGTHPWGFLRTRVEGGGPAFRVLEALTEMRARSLRLPYGDQGVLVRRALYEAVGGYAEVPLMEDVLLARRLARHAAPALVGGTLLVDARRWKRHGLLGATARNLATLFRFSVLHRDPAHLAATYDHRILSP
jgi:rSAM/selenodomain-associated transferase 2/rSAM/selenodomain-associated transferase 1